MSRTAAAELAQTELGQYLTNFPVPVDQINDLLAMYTQGRG